LGRIARPYYRAHEKAWYATINGKPRQRLLVGRNNAADRRRAQEIFEQLKSTTTVPADSDPSVAILEAYLDYSLEHHARATYDLKRHHLNLFSAFAGRVKIRDLILHHATRLLSTQKEWSAWSKATFIRDLKACFNWARREGLISSNPFADLTKPRTESRQATLTRDELARILQSANPCFRRFLHALRHTGARPGDIARVTAAHFDEANCCWVLPQHKTRLHTGKAKVIWLTPVMLRTTRHLIRRFPAGPLFRTESGSQWKKNNIAQTFRRLKKRLGIDDKSVPYSLRHTFCTDALSAGVPIKTVAELVGHTSTRMIDMHYGHLDQKTEHLQEAVRMANRRQS